MKIVGWMKRGRTSGTSPSVLTPPSRFSSIPWFCPSQAFKSRSSTCTSLKNCLLCKSAHDITDVYLCDGDISSCDGNYQNCQIYLFTDNILLFFEINWLVKYLSMPPITSYYKDPPANLRCCVERAWSRGCALQIP